MGNSSSSGMTSRTTRNDTIFPWACFLDGGSQLTVTLWAVEEEQVTSEGAAPGTCCVHELHKMSLLAFFLFLLSCHHQYIQRRWDVIIHFPDKTKHTRSIYENSSIFSISLRIALELESKMKILYDAVFKFFRQKLVFKLAQYSFWDALIKINGKTYN